jgi:hypothetical protein
MSYARSVVKSLQRGTIALSGTSTTETDTATISSVATDKSFVTYSGFHGASNSGSAPFEAQAMYVLTNATTVSVTRTGGANSTDKTVSYQVVEYF